MRIKGNERHLRIDDRLIEFLEPCVPLFDLLIDLGERGLDGLRRNPLQLGIKRRVDAQTFAVEVAIAKFLHELIVHQVHEVRSLAGVDADGSRCRGSSLARSA